MTRLPILLLLLLFLGACNTYYKLVPADRLNIGDAYSVDPQIQWSTFDLNVRVPVGGDDLAERDVASTAKHQAWTVDGSKLQAVFFYYGVQEGDTLFPGLGLEDAKFPTFKPDMRASDVMEFLVDSYERLGLTQVVATNLRPAEFGNAPGFRFELTYLSAAGLEYEAMALGAVNDGQLSLIIYDGVRHFYYPRYREAVERLFSSVQMI